jgi:hypothetical protein
VIDEQRKCKFWNQSIANISCKFIIEGEILK